MIILPKTAVAFLESMGLPQPMLTTTRQQVEKGKLDWSNSLEWKMYSRHDKPRDEQERNEQAEIAAQAGTHR